MLLSSVLLSVSATLSIILGTTDLERPTQGYCIRFSLSVAFKTCPRYISAVYSHTEYEFRSSSTKLMAEHPELMATLS